MAMKIYYVYDYVKACCQFHGLFIAVKHAVKTCVRQCKQYSMNRSYVFNEKFAIRNVKNGEKKREKEDCDEKK